MTAKPTIINTTVIMFTELICGGSVHILHEFLYLNLNLKTAALQLRQSISSASVYELQNIKSAEVGCDWHNIF